MTTSKSVPWYFTPMIVLLWWVCIELGLFAALIHIPIRETRAESFAVA